MSTSKLTQFAQAVGADIKAINAELASKATQEGLTQAIAEAKTTLKSEILGEGVPEQLDTLKELGQKVDTIANLDLVAVYTSAKV